MSYGWQATHAHACQLVRELRLASHARSRYAPLNLLLLDPHLPVWLTELSLGSLRVGAAVIDLRFWRTTHGDSDYEVSSGHCLASVIPISSMRFEQRRGQCVERPYADLHRNRACPVAAAPPRVGSRR